MKRIVLIFLGIIFCSATLASAQSMSIPQHEIQLRVYTDRGFGLPNGDQGNYVQAYGIRITDNGSEEVVWRIKIKNSLSIQAAIMKFEYVHVRDSVYLYFPDGFETRVATDNPNAYEIRVNTPCFKINRATGLKEIIDSESDQFKQLRSRFQWVVSTTLLRPALEAPMKFE
ncbi:MAG: hypothetical protein K8S27_07380 [Candidatus Omnitrophica bacterium]|nr:hypothetical protein [Candidatus Omnitrophota bacterium]